MSEVFSYPITQSEFWLNNYAVITWALGMLLLSVAWAIFFRYGNFKYGIDLGCLGKTFLILFFTTMAFGLPMRYNIRFDAEHGHEGDRITLSESKLIYQQRGGKEKNLPIKDIKKIYQEPITYNPPVKYFIVAETAGAKDSVAVKKDLPDFDKFIQKLTELTQVKIRRAL
ncbi:MAG: hypothetical protein HGB19_01025 [Chlorobiales bacterium]|jgi:hypothetical protein|nr:hypothetical protein [Chlorobiales bacterium]